MEFFVANFIANKEDFFKAKIQQSDNEHVSVNGINSWNDHNLLISSLDRSIDLIIIDGSLKINFTLPISSIDNDKENYREIFEQLHYKSSKKSYEVSREFKTFTKVMFKGLYHEIFDIEVSKLRNLNQISSLLNQNYVELLNEFLRFISPIYNHKFTAYDYKEIINFVENVIGNLDVRYVLFENNIVSKISIKSSMDINIQLEVYSLNVFNNKYDIRIMVGNKHDFRIDLEIQINGKNELHFNFTSYHLKAEYRI